MSIGSCRTVARSAREALAPVALALCAGGAWGAPPASVEDRVPCVRHRIHAALARLADAGGVRDHAVSLGACTPARLPTPALHFDSVPLDGPSVESSGLVDASLDLPVDAGPVYWLLGPAPVLDAPAHGSELLGEAFDVLEFDLSVAGAELRGLDAAVLIAAR